MSTVIESIPVNMKLEDIIDVTIKSEPELLHSRIQETLPNFVYQAVTAVRTGASDVKEDDFQFKIPHTVKKRGRKRKRNVHTADEIVKPVRDVCTSPEIERIKRPRRLYRDEVLQLICEWRNCVEKCSRPEDFIRHVATVHVGQVEVKQNPPPLPDVFVCLWSDCGFETPDSGEMVRHVNFHSFHTKLKCHGQNMLNINADLSPCRLDWTKRNILPDMSVPFTCQWSGCDIPDIQWKSAQDFYWHCKSHADERRGLSILCQWTECIKLEFSAVSKLAEHLRCHSQERLVGCPTCGGLFANRIKFFDHCKRQQEVDLESSFFSCPICGKKFALERLLKDHSRAHVNHHKCPHCDMTCVTPSTLANHIRYRHTTEKPFSCEFCSYRGKTLSDVKSHVRVHYTEVEMQCEENDCQFTCRAKLTMKKHLADKHGVGTSDLVSRQYGCHMCEERFNLGSQLTKHITGVHQFTWPSGHSRFRYTRDKESGLLTLQTVRVESLGLQELGVAGVTIQEKPEEYEDNIIY